MLKKVGLLAVVLICALLITQIVWAKGPVDRVGVTGGGIGADEFFSTRAELLAPLSFVMFENVNAEVEPLQDAGDPYTMTRYYQTIESRFEPFDRVEYYPDAEVVHVLGIVNGSSEYDDRWFEVTPQGAAAFDLLLVQAATESYLAVADERGSIHFFDPNTLALRGTYDAAFMPLYADDLRADVSGRGLILNLNGEAQGQLQINLESDGQCFLAGEQRSDQQTITSFDGRWQATITHQADRFAVTVSAGSWGTHTIQLEPPTDDLTYSGAWDAEAGKLYLLHTREGVATLTIFYALRDSRTWHVALDVDGADALQMMGAEANIVYLYAPMTDGADSPSGVLAVDAFDGEMWRLLDDLPLLYAHLDDATGSLYGITSDDGEDWRVFASSLDGEMLATQPLAVQPINGLGTAANIVRLSPDVVQIVASGGAVDRPARNPFDECATVNPVWGA